MIPNVAHIFVAYSVLNDRQVVKYRHSPSSLLLMTGAQLSHLRCKAL